MPGAPPCAGATTPLAASGGAFLDMPEPQSRLPGPLGGEWLQHAAECDIAAHAAQPGCTAIVPFLDLQDALSRGAVGAATAAAAAAMICSPSEARSRQHILVPGAVLGGDGHRFGHEEDQGEELVMEMDCN